MLFSFVGKTRLSRLAATWSVSLASTCGALSQGFQPTMAHGGPVGAAPQGMIGQIGEEIGVIKRAALG